MFAVNPQEVFQRFLAQLAQIVSSFLQMLANEVFSHRMISRETRIKAGVASPTPLERANYLLLALNPRINHKNFEKLCKILSKFETADKLSTQMMENYSKFL